VNPGMLEKIGRPLSDPGMYSPGSEKSCKFEKISKIGRPLSDPGMYSPGSEKSDNV
jgi:hypothetical protein